MQIVFFYTCEIGIEMNRVSVGTSNVPTQSEGDNNEEEKDYGKLSAELESVDLPLENTLRYL